MRSVFCLEELRQINRNDWDVSAIVIFSLSDEEEEEEKKFVY
jgi:hypothetical protein